MDDPDNEEKDSETSGKNGDRGHPEEEVEEQVQDPDGRLRRIEHHALRPRTCTEPAQGAAEPKLPTMCDGEKEPGESDQDAECNAGMDHPLAGPLGNRLEDGPPPPFGQKEEPHQSQQGDKGGHEDPDRPRTE